MTSREYSCELQYWGTSSFWGSNDWQRTGSPLLIRIDLASMPSKMNALLEAIRGHTSKQGPIENYRLQVRDEDMNVFNTICATDNHLELHEAGYPVSVADGTVPQALKDFSDDQLIAELRRRLTVQASEPEAPPQ